MQRRFRKIFTALSEHSSVRYAKIATVGGFCNVELIITKATAPDDLPLPEKYVQELLKIFSISPSSPRKFSLGFARRFGKTRSWRVALKCLILLHKLLRSVPEDGRLRSELLWTRSSGLMSLNQCHFRDDSSSSSEDYTAFVRSYAQLLDEALHCFWFDSNPATCESEQQQEEDKVEHQEYADQYEDDEQEEEEETQFESLSNRMKKVGQMLEMLPQLQTLIDLAMDCRPTGSASKAFLVHVAMKQIIRDSFMCYTIFRREIVMVLDSLFQTPYRSCILAFGIYKKAAVQANKLSEFYEWCKSMGFCGSYEYPFVDQIPHIQIHALENFLHGMWQLTDQSSSTQTSSPTSSASMPSTSFVEYSSSTHTDDDACDKLVVDGTQTKNIHHILVSTKWEKPLVRFDVGSCEEEKPLIEFDSCCYDKEKPSIHFEDDDVDIVAVEDGSWESLLEASIDISPPATGDSDHQQDIICFDSNALNNPFCYQQVMMSSNCYASIHGDCNICYAQF